MIVSKFFEAYSVWDWNNYVSLNEIDKEIKDGLVPFNPDTASAPFAVVTPMFPALNSTRDVSVSTRHQLVKEFKRGKSLVSEKGFEESTLEEICIKRDFFADYNHFVEVSVSGSQSSVDGITGFVGAKMKRLMEILENPGNFSIRMGYQQMMPLQPSFVKYAMPFPGSIKRETVSEYGEPETVHSYFIGMVMGRYRMLVKGDVLLVNHFYHYERFNEELGKKIGSTCSRVNIKITPFSKYSFPAYVKEYVEKVDSEIKPQRTLENIGNGENDGNDDDDVDQKSPVLKKPKTEPTN